MKSSAGITTFLVSRRLMKRKSSAVHARDGDDQPAAPAAGGGAVRHSAGDPDDRDAEASRAKTKRQPAALPWMRTPVALDAGTAVPLTHVRGLHAQLILCLEAGAEHLPGLLLSQLPCYHRRGSEAWLAPVRPPWGLCRLLMHVDAAVSLAGTQKQVGPFLLA